MSWGRFLVVGAVTLLLLIPITPLVGAGVTGIGEPMRTVVILVIGVAVFFGVDRFLLHFFPGLRNAGRSD